MHVREGFEPLAWLFLTVLLHAGGNNSLENMVLACNDALFSQRICVDNLSCLASKSYI